MKRQDLWGVGMTGNGALEKESFSTHRFKNKVRDEGSLCWIVGTRSPYRDEIF